MFADKIMRSILEQQAFFLDRWGSMSARRAFLPRIIGRQNWGKIFTDADLWRPVVLDICRQHGLKDVQQIVPGYPGSCAVFIVDQTAVVKIYPPMFAADFDRERLVYHAIQDRFEKIPKVLSTGVFQDRIDWPYLIISYCPGQPIREAGPLLKAEDKMAIGESLGKMICRLHETAVPEGLARSWGQWREILLQNRERTLSHLKQEQPFSGQVLLEIEQYLTRMEPVWLQEGPLSLINADLTEDHLLLVKKEGLWHISAVIDWADAEVGAVDYEWVALWYGLCGQDAQMFQAVLSTGGAGVEIDEAFGERLLAFTFLHRFAAEIVIQMWKEQGRPSIRNLADLRAVLLPNFPEVPGFRENNYS